MSASEIRYFEKWSSMVARVSFILFANHSIDTLEASGWARPSSTFHPFTSLSAFHILLLKFLPCSHKPSSKGRSFPAGEVRSIPTLTPSAPYFSINSIGSGEFPNDFDIFLPCLSRTIPVRYTFLKGTSFRYSSPAMIIRATQKNNISGAVTRSLVG